MYNWHAGKYEVNDCHRFTDKAFYTTMPNDIVKNQFGKKGHPSISGPARVEPTFVDIHWTQQYTARRFQETTCDDVYCMPCINWPSEARQWFSRERKHGWPDEDTIRNVWNGGCHVVPVAHPDYKFDRFQWRYSFSKAEVILLRTWTPNQQIVYHLLRYFVRHELMKKNLVTNKTSLCNYHLKTLMLHACERKSQEWWSMNCVILLCSKLLGIFKRWFQERWLSNYFMPGVNLLDFEMNEFECVRVIEVLEKFSNTKHLSRWFKRKYFIEAFAGISEMSQGWKRMISNNVEIFMKSTIDDLEIHSITSNSYAISVLYLKYPWHKNLFKKLIANNLRSPAEQLLDKAMCFFALLGI